MARLKAIRKPNSVFRFQNFAIIIHCFSIEFYILSALKSRVNAVEKENPSFTQNFRQSAIEIKFSIKLDSIEKTIFTNGANNVLTFFLPTEIKRERDEIAWNLGHDSSSYFMFQEIEWLNFSFMRFRLKKLPMPMSKQLDLHSRYSLVDSIRDRDDVSCVGD